MRARLRLVIALVLVAALGAGGFLFARQAVERQREAAAAREIVDVLPDVSQRIQHFRRVKVDEQGKKIWEVSADEAQYREGEGLVAVRAPMVAFFLRDGREVSLRGETGTVFLDGKELRRIELQGAIDVQLGEYALTTDRASYEADRDLVIAPGMVHIRGKGLDVQGAGMEVQVGAQRLTLTQNVQMTLWPKT
ncbi:MAG: LPS export ABC transporter periplasmic protein LptC [Deltaproteobacteria bacterium]|nr:LPS export ABC transporter periplasmic protein LptC [Deltaproteobacteria bacterium]